VLVFQLSGGIICLFVLFFADDHNIAVFFVLLEVVEVFVSEAPVVSELIAVSHEDRPFASVAFREAALFDFIGDLFADDYFLSVVFVYDVFGFALEIGVALLAELVIIYLLLLLIGIFKLLFAFALLIGICTSFENLFDKWVLFDKTLQPILFARVG
jgi:hypothetical protein